MNASCLIYGMVSWFQQSVITKMVSITLLLSSGLGLALLENEQQQFVKTWMCQGMSNFDVIMNLSSRSWMWR